MLPSLRIIFCDYINPESDTKASLQRNGAIVLKLHQKDDLFTYKFYDLGPMIEMLKKYAHKKGCEIEDYSDQLVMPAFFDMHFHWVQDNVRSKPKADLLHWLKNYTWPYEAKFKDKKYSKIQSEKFLDELLQVGTMGGAIYSALFPHTVDHALDHFHGYFTVGNVLMTMESPKYLTHSKKIALSSVQKLSKKYNEKYCLTPRFAITTHPEVMSEAAKIAKKNKSFIQTHLSETKGEIDFVLSLFRKFKGFEKVKSYTEIYHKCNILGPKTILGHCIHLDNDEWKILSKTKSIIAHCPTSNAPIKELGLGSGLFDFRRAEKEKVRWVLGSDIGGGPYLSMFDVMKSFVEQNKKKKINEATYIKALNRATKMSAEVMGVGKKLGSLDKNKLANFIMVPTPKSIKGETAETVIFELIKSVKKRSDFQTLIDYSFYLGIPIYKK